MTPDWPSRSRFDTQIDRRAKDRKTLFENMPSDCQASAIDALIAFLRRASETSGAAQVRLGLGTWYASLGTKLSYTPAAIGFEICSYPASYAHKTRQFFSLADEVYPSSLGVSVNRQAIGALFHAGLA